MANVASVQWTLMILSHDLLDVITISCINHKSLWKFSCELFDKMKKLLKDVLA